MTMSLNENKKENECTGYTCRTDCTDHDLTYNDTILPYIYPFTGQFNQTIYQKLCKLLCTCFDNRYGISGYSKKQLNRDINFIKEHMMHGLSIRYQDISAAKQNCHKKTLDHAIVRQISDLLMPDIRIQASKLTIPPTNIIIDPTHGDLLYYDERSRFVVKAKARCSKETKEYQYDYLSSWRHYYMIIGIHSNISHRTKVNDGAIEIYIPSRALPILGMWIKTKGKKLTQHIYADGYLPGRFLIFPADALHRDVKISQKGYKLILKLNLWLKLPSLTPESINELSAQSFNVECTCRRCNSGKLLLNQLIRSLIKHIDKLCANILIIIAEYCIDTIRQECTCVDEQFIARNYPYTDPYTDPCSCTCFKCIKNIKCSREYESGSETESWSGSESGEETEF
jgi:hypothetical protein